MERAWFDALGTKQLVCSFSLPLRRKKDNGSVAAGYRREDLKTICLKDDSQILLDDSI